MVASAALMNHESNPLDTVEQLASFNDWMVDRRGEDEMIVMASSIWADLQVSLNWHEELEGLHLACSFDLKVPPSRRDEVVRLIGLLNAHLMFGHFDLWNHEGALIYRNGLILAGGAEATPTQCEALIHLAVDSCERYFPAFQYVIWAGRSAQEAISASMMDTQGEA